VTPIPGPFAPEVGVTRLPAPQCWIKSNYLRAESGPQLIVGMCCKSDTSPSNGTQIALESDEHPLKVVSKWHRLPNASSGPDLTRTPNPPRSGQLFDIDHWVQKQLPIALPDELLQPLTGLSWPLFVCCTPQLTARLLRERVLFARSRTERSLPTL
jgi:hypothetical protein